MTEIEYFYTYFLYIYLQTMFNFSKNYLHGSGKNLLMTGIKFLNIFMLTWYLTLPDGGMILRT